MAEQTTTPTIDVSPGASIPTEFDSLLEEVSAEQPVPDEFTDLLFETEPDRQSMAVMSKETVEQIDRMGEQVVVPGIPTPEETPDTNPFADIAKGVGRSVTGIIGGAASLPRVVVEALPGNPDDGIADILVRNTTDKVAEALDSANRSQFLAPNRAAQIQAEGWAYLGEAVTTPEWWTNRFPELASSSVSFLIPGAGASKLSRAVGFTERQAARFGKSVSLAVAFASESGSTYNDLVAQLKAQGVPSDDARDIASRGSLAYGVAAAAIEAGLIDFLKGSQGSSAFMRIIRGGAGEITQEEMQLFAQWSTMAIVENMYDIELRKPGLTDAIESAIAAGPAGAALGATGVTDAFSEQQQALEQVAETMGVPVETVEKLVYDQMESDPKQNTFEEEETTEAPAAPEPSPAPTSPTEATATAPEATGEGEGVIEQSDPEIPDEPDTPRVPEAEKADLLQQAFDEAGRRDQAKESQLDDLIKQVVNNLPSVLSKEQALALVNKANEAVTHKQLRAVIGEIRKRVATAQKKKAQDRLKKVLDAIDPNKLPPETRSAVNELINTLDTTKASKQTKKTLESMRKYMKRGGQVPQREADKTSRLDKRPVASLSEIEANEIADELTRVVRQARLSQAIRLRRKKRNLAEAIEQITSELERESGKQFDAKLKAHREASDAIHFLINTAISQEQASIFESLLELMSGSDQTATVDVLFRQVFDANNQMLARIFRLKDAREEAMRQVGIKNPLDWIRPGDGLLEKTLRELGFVRGNTEPETIDLPSGRTIELYKAERTALLEDLMDTETRDLLVFDNVPVKLPGMAEGESIVLSADDIQAIVDSATAQERALALWQVETYNGQEAEDYGEATRTIFGRSLVRPGRYVPRYRVNEQKDTTFDAKFIRQKAIKNARINLERNPHDKANPLKLVDAFNRFDSWATMHSAVIELAPSVEQAMSVIESRDFKNSVRNRFGDKTLKRIKSYYNELMRQTVGGSFNNEILGKEARITFNSISQGLLFARPQVAGYQFASFFTLMTEMKSEHVTSAIRDFASSQLDTEINRYSPYLRERKEGGGVRLVETSARDDKRQFDSFRKENATQAQKMADMAGAGMIRSVDGGVIRVAWSAAKKQAQADGYEDEALMKRAAQIAEKAVRRTQPTWDALSITGLALEARSSGLARAINFFRAMRAKNVDMTKMIVARRVRGQISTSEATRQMFLVNVAQPLYITSVRWAWRYFLWTLVQGATFAVTGDWEKEEKDIAKETKSFLTDVFSTVVTNYAFGDIVDGMVRTIMGERAFDPQLSPVSGLITNTTRGGNQLASGLAEGDVIRFIKGAQKAISGVAALYGIPVGVALDPLVDLIESISEAEKPRKRSSGR